MIWWLDKLFFICFNFFLRNLGFFLHIGKSGGQIINFASEILTEASWDWFKTLEMLFKFVWCMKYSQFAFSSSTDGEIGPLSSKFDWKFKNQAKNCHFSYLSTAYTVKPNIICGRSYWLFRTQLVCTALLGSFLVALHVILRRK